MSYKITIPAGTVAELNNIPITFVTDADVDFPCTSIDHAAELCHAGGLVIDLSHIDNGKQIRYGAGGKRLEVDLPAKEAAKEPVKEVAKVPVNEPATKAKPHK